MPDVPEVLLQHEKIRECAVVGKPDETWGEKARLAPICPPPPLPTISPSGAEVTAVCVLQSGVALTIKEPSSKVEDDIPLFILHFFGTGGGGGRHCECVGVVSGRPSRAELAPSSLQSSREELRDWGKERMASYKAKERSEYGVVWKIWFGNVPP